MNIKLILAGASVLVLAGCGTTGTTQTGSIPLHGYAAGLGVYVDGDGVTPHDENPSVAYSYDEDTDVVTLTFLTGDLAGGTVQIREDGEDIEAVGGSLTDLFDVRGIQMIRGEHAIAGTLALREIDGDDFQAVALHTGVKPDSISNLADEARYAGNVIAYNLDGPGNKQGTFTLIANFTGKTFDGSMIGLGDDPLIFAGGLNTNATFSGVFTDFDGQIEGAFYGPGAVETAGAFSVEADDTYFGAFHGTKAP